MITVRGREMIIPQSERQIGTNYDVNAENRQFQIKRFTAGGVDLSALSFKLNLEYAGGDLDTCLLDSVVEDEDIVLNWEIMKGCVQQPGTVWASIRGHDENGTVKWATNRGAFYVERTTEAPGGSTGLTELEQLEQRIKEKTETLDANESSRQEAEKLREENETARKNNEAEWQRQAAEAISQAEEAVTQAGQSAAEASGKAEEAAEAAEAATAASTAAGNSAASAASSASTAEQIAEGLGGFNGTAASVSASDVLGLVGETEGTSNVQALINAIAQKVVNELVTNTALTEVLASYVTKAMIVNNALTTEAGVGVLDAAMGKTLGDAVAQLNGNMLQLDTLNYSVDCTSQSSSVLGGYYGSKRLDSNENYTASKKYMVISCYNSGNGTIIGCATIQGVNIRVSAAGSGTYSCVLLALGKG